MIIKSSLVAIKVLFALSLTFGLSYQATSATVARSDILLHIATQCVDPSKTHYCSSCMLPRADAGCGAISECKKTTEVWALNKKYTAIRDIKMCGCPASFVHGLAIPKDVVTGIEDQNRKEDIWQFAWNVGLERIESASLALVVNPKSDRSQNQLHVHILRLGKNARVRFSDYSHAYVQNLDWVWSVAQRLANSQGLSDYGVLVAQESSGQYIVVISPRSPEAAFTVWSCNP